MVSDSCCYVTYGSCCYMKLGDGRDRVVRENSGGDFSSLLLLLSFFSLFREVICCCYRFYCFKCVVDNRCARRTY